MIAHYYCYYNLILMALCTWPKQYYNLWNRKYDQYHNIIQLYVYAKDMLLLLLWYRIKIPLVGVRTFSCGGEHARRNTSFSVGRYRLHSLVYCYVTRFKNTYVPLYSTIYTILYYYIVKCIRVYICIRASKSSTRRKEFSFSIYDDCYTRRCLSTWINISQTCLFCVEDLGVQNNRHPTIPTALYHYNVPETDSCTWYYVRSHGCRD